MNETETIEQRRERVTGEVIARLAGWDGAGGIWVYLSFVDEDLPKGTQFLGACIVRAPDVPSAPFIAHRKGCNPGGQAMMAKLNELSQAPFMTKYFDRLLSKADLEQMDREAAEWVAAHEKASG